MSKSKREGFNSKLGIIAAAAGSAIGLGNVWRFPYVAGENGGGAFLLIYLLFVLALGVPVMLSELVIGRKSQKNIFGAFHVLAPGKKWYLIGLLGVVTAFVILSFYAVVAGWTLEYLHMSITNSLANKSPADLSETFAKATTGSYRTVLMIVIFMGVSAYIVKSGVGQGIEKYSKLLMPLLIVIIVLLGIRSITLEGSKEGLLFLFKPDFSAINAKVVLEALGQAFFSLSLGMGVMATYGSYIEKNESLGSTAIYVSMADTIIAILAGIAIFPAVFAFGIEPGSGPGLVFETLPNIFNQMTGGYFFSVIFFVLLAIAALTSSISLLEVVVAYFSEELSINRKKSTAIAAVSITLLSLMCMKYDVVFSLFDKVSSNVLLPVGGFLIVLFVGWFMKNVDIKNELEADGKIAHYFRFFVLIIKFLAPIAIAFVFLNQLGLI